jgi:hypothetical protein
MASAAEFSKLNVMISLGPNGKVIIASLPLAAKDGFDELPLLADQIHYRSAGT